MHFISNSMYDRLVFVISDIFGDLLNCFLIQRKFTFVFPQSLLVKSFLFEIIPVGNDRFSERFQIDVRVEEMVANKGRVLVVRILFAILIGTVKDSGDFPFAGFLGDVDALLRETSGEFPVVLRILYSLRSLHFLNKIIHL